MRAIVGSGNKVPSVNPRFQDVQGQRGINVVMF